MVSCPIQALKIYGIVIQLGISLPMVGLQYHKNNLCKNKEKFIIYFELERF